MEVAELLCSFDPPAESVHVDSGSMHMKSLTSSPHITYTSLYRVPQDPKGVARLG